MARQILAILSIIVITSATSYRNDVKCNDFHANFTLQKIIGPWFVVAIIPERMFPEYQEQVTCYKVEFSDSEVAGLRWLANRTFEDPRPEQFFDRIKGTIVRQRYHSVPPFDVWSSSVEGVNGCFQQVLSLNTDKSDISIYHVEDEDPNPLETFMQLHIHESLDGSGPILLQLLWGKMISAVIYRRSQGVTSEQLEPILELVTKLRGPQIKPKLCDRSLRDLLGFGHS